MNYLQIYCDIIRGVGIEFWNDVGDVMWATLDLVGCQEVVETIIRDLRLLNRHKSFVRVIASSLPLKPVKRPYLRFVALGSLSTSCDSLFSLNTQNFNGFSNKVSVDKDTLLHNKSNLHHVASSPAIFISTSVMQDENPKFNEAFNETTNEKITALEEELAALRSEIASIIYKSVERPLTPPSTPLSSFTPPPLSISPLQETASFITTIPSSLPPRSIPCCPPPAPPPPPPLPVSLTSFAVKPKSFSELIAENKSSINQHKIPVEIQSSAAPNNCSMTDVLKGLNKVKLKKIDRSPGGTPVRSKCRSPSPSDPASIIAAALKKRFASINSLSPDKIHRSTPSAFSSPENSPSGSRKSRWDKFSPKLSEKVFIGNHGKNKLRPTGLSPVLNKSASNNSIPPFGQHLLKKRADTPMS